MLTGEYHAYLLRMWRAQGDGKQWRALLEDVETGEEHGFASLAKLIEFLQGMDAEEDSTGWSKEE